MVDFESLAEEKRRGILNAAFSCFGKNGYKKASVADIAAAAGISKASIFQYFGTKRGLYLYLYEFSCQRILEQMPRGSEDFFEFMRLGAESKVRTMAKYGGMSDFLTSMVVESSEEVVDILQRDGRTRVLGDVSQLFASIKWDRFKPELSKETVFNIVRWVNGGYLKEAVGTKSVDTMLRELNEYLDLLKTLLYKEEYLK